MLGGQLGQLINVVGGARFVVEVYVDMEVVVMQEHAELILTADSLQ